jgi:hypothetical protein
MMQTEKQTPTIGMVVKLRHGMLQLSARQVQYITKVKPLAIGKDGIMTPADYQNEGGYWIKTDHTKGEWWAWSLFRVA